MLCTLGGNPFGQTIGGGGTIGSEIVSPAWFIPGHTKTLALGLSIPFRRLANDGRLGQGDASTMTVCIAHQCLDHNIATLSYRLKACSRWIRFRISSRRNFLTRTQILHRYFLRRRYRGTPSTFRADPCELADYFLRTYKDSTLANCSSHQVLSLHSRTSLSPDPAPAQTVTRASCPRPSGACLTEVPKRSRRFGHMDQPAFRNARNYCVSTDVTTNVAKHDRKTARRSRLNTNIVKCGAAFWTTSDTP